ncbi:MAG: DUF4157 domain-containing protein [Anaerolineales bacterium]
MAMPEPRVQRACPSCEDETLQKKPIAEKITSLVQRQEQPEEDEESVQAKREGENSLRPTPGLDTQIHALQGGGAPLPPFIRTFFEQRFGSDLGDVRVHAGLQASETAKSIQAHAFTLGRDVVFGQGRFSPDSPGGKKLLAHELTHVVQQKGAGGSKDGSRRLSASAQPVIQRTLKDGHDLSSPRFSKLPDLEGTYDGELIIAKGSSGRGVQAVQHALYDLGFFPPAPKLVYGADGYFHNETKAAVMKFQKDNQLQADGWIGKNTMTALDKRFAAFPSLPAPAIRSAPWTVKCVKSILCPRSPHTLKVLKDRITLQSYVHLIDTEEQWNGSAWIPQKTSIPAYYNKNEIGLNYLLSCEKAAQALYHEVLHAEQPSRHKTDLHRESYAYRIGEEFNIGTGLPGYSGFHRPGPYGRKYADPAKVASAISPGGVIPYSNVPKRSNEKKILGKGSRYGTVIVLLDSNRKYERLAYMGESLFIDRDFKSLWIHGNPDWTCP